jgi:hypothetical protein
MKVRHGIYVFLWEQHSLQIVCTTKKECHDEELPTLCARTGSFLVRYLSKQIEQAEQNRKRENKGQWNNKDVKSNLP